MVFNKQIYFVLFGENEEWEGISSPFPKAWEVVKPELQNDEEGEVVNTELQEENTDWDTENNEASEEEEEWDEIHSETLNNDNINDIEKDVEKDENNTWTKE